MVHCGQRRFKKPLAIANNHNMKATSLLIFLIVLTTRLFSQASDKDSLRITYAQFDSVDRIQVIPFNALSGDYDLLIVGFEFDTANIVDKKAIEISWPSLYIDGRYDLVITAKQLYLKSGHENPNPNHLYWMTSISKTQYDLIKSYLNARSSKAFQRCYRQSYCYKKYKKEKYVRDGWTNRQYENFVRLLAIVNKPLELNDKILIPPFESFNSIRPLQLVHGVEEIGSQIKIIKSE
jgi:hypothetical protein